MMISGVTKENSITKFDVPEPRLRHRLIPTANSTPIGTATSIVSVASLRLCRSAVRMVGSCATDSSGSPQYHRNEKPCQVLLLRPELKENSTARATGTSDQARYRRVNAIRKRGLPQGLASQSRTRRVPPRVSPAATADSGLTV